MTRTENRNTEKNSLGMEDKVTNMNSYASNCPNIAQPKNRMDKCNNTDCLIQEEK